MRIMFNPDSVRGVDATWDAMNEMGIASVRQQLLTLLHSHHHPQETQRIVAALESLNFVGVANAPVEKQGKLVQGNLIVCLTVRRDVAMVIQKLLEQSCGELGHCSIVEPSPIVDLGGSTTTGTSHALPGSLV